jgi:ATP-dependent HslUV protease ATP-binding subunit HslU
MDMTPRQIVAELDRYIIGQDKAKRAVAVALRNRYRRNKLSPEMAEEVTPKNILMMGPTGVGKTEIARRLAKLVKAPFIKVEATKFTEVGYVGRDVDSIVRDLVEAAIHMVREERVGGVGDLAKQAAQERLIDLLMPRDKRDAQPKQAQQFPFALFAPQTTQPAKPETPEEIALRESTKDAVRMQLENGLLEDQMVEIEVEEKANVGMDMSSMGVDLNMGDMLEGILPKKTKIRKLKVSEARRVLEQEEANKLVDKEDINGEALKRAERDGIVFIDEIDKIAGRQSGGGGPDVSREGVQRDILPIVEGSTVNTKYGPVKTDYMLFLAAGAFHVAKVEDLIPELQGRFPIRVALTSLTAEDFRRILTETENAQTKQYAALLATEGVIVKYTDDGIKAIADFAYEANESSENLGARRLHGIMEELLEDVSFNADTVKGEVVVDEAFVLSRMQHKFDVASLKKFIL